MRGGPRRGAAGAPRGLLARALLGAAAPSRGRRYFALHTAYGPGWESTCRVIKIAPHGEHLRTPARSRLLCRGDARRSARRRGTPHGGGGMPRPAASAGAAWRGFPPPSAAESVRICPACANPAGLQARAPAAPPEAKRQGRWGGRDLRAGGRAVVRLEGGRAPCEATRDGVRWQAAAV